MISIIICSKHKGVSQEFLDNIANTISVEYELFQVDNSYNRYTLFSAYNAGIRRSKGEYICFLHEDVVFHTEHWGQKVIEHLQVPNVGICGVAGYEIVTRVPILCKDNIQCMNIIQSDNNGKKRSRMKVKPKNCNQLRRSVAVLDGVMLCMKRELVEHIKFDEELGEFHGYDVDICMQSIAQGCDNYVMYDVLLKHFSRGNRDTDYYRAMLRVFKKWSGHLPFSGLEIKKNQTIDIAKIEVKAISNLLAKMARRDFHTHEIIAEIEYFTQLLGLRSLRFIPSLLKTEISMVRLLNSLAVVIKKLENR